MNLSSVVLVILALKLVNGQPKTDFSAFLSDDTKNILDGMQKLSSKNCTDSDKMSALFQMMSNPVFSDILFKTSGKHGAPQSTTADAAPKQEFSNSEGYAFTQPSVQAKEFFKAVDNIADAEVKNKLYWFYDNWYVK